MKNPDLRSGLSSVLSGGKPEKATGLSEEAKTMDSEYQQARAALKEIRDCTLLLNFGKDYLCEEPFLKKTGKAIEGHLAELKERAAKSSASQ